MENYDRPAEETVQDEQYGSKLSPRIWRACCLAPVIAVALLLVFTISALMYTNRSRLLPWPASRPPEMAQRRVAMAQFARDYFLTAKQADDAGGKALVELRMLASGNSTIERMHGAFQAAVGQNRRAAESFRAMEVPMNLYARDRLRQSLSQVAESYDARREACETMVGWSGDTSDRATAKRFRSQVERINALTESALIALHEAASDNGLTADDLRRVLTQGSLEPWVAP